MGEEAIRITELTNPDLVLMDIMFNGDMFNGDMFNGDMFNGDLVGIEAACLNNFRDF
ncbi:hypothetical protein [Methanosarcina sp. WH1]|uniref:hypothetical protein n=1 Tax=Methanosarcina sp. WH1 TaxID=1434102 RepID=UPI000A72D218|nr:hypothetical protein [Methanosarcina sp. WH1]